MKTVRTATLEIAYEETGPGGGAPASCCMAFPYDVRAYDGWRRHWRPPAGACSCPTCAATGRPGFSSAATPRSGQQAALGRDLADFMDALGLNAPSWPATTGAAAPPASWRRYGRSASRLW